MKRISNDGLYSLLIFIGIFPLVLLIHLTRSTIWAYGILFLLMWGTFSILYGSYPQQPLLPNQACLFCGSSRLKKTGRQRLDCENCKGAYSIDRNGWVQVLENPQSRNLSAQIEDQITDRPLPRFRILDPGKPVRSGLIITLIISLAILILFLSLFALGYLAIYSR